MTSRYVCRFEKEMYDEWLAGVDEACSFNLNQPLISRSEESKLISVNFDPQLVAVLREVSAFFHKKSHPTYMFFTVGFFAGALLGAASTGEHSRECSCDL